MGFKFFSAIGITLMLFIGIFIYYNIKRPDGNYIEVSKDKNDNTELPRVSKDRTYNTKLPKVLPHIRCMLFTTPEYFYTKARAVNLTWTRRCDSRTFYFSKTKKFNMTLPSTHALDVREGRQDLTTKTMAAIKHSYNTLHNTSINWYLKADDDVYIIMENLQHLLLQYNPDESVYIGFWSHTIIKHGYNSGGAGYLLSKTAVENLLEAAVKYPDVCKSQGAIEDLDIGKCLAALGIFPTDTRDSDGKETFFFYNALGLNQFGEINENKLSPYAISFHYVKPEEIYAAESIFYGTRKQSVKSIENIKLMIKYHRKTFDKLKKINHKNVV